MSDERHSSENICHYLVFSGQKVDWALRLLEDGDLGDCEAQTLALAVVVKVLGLEEGVGLLDVPEHLQDGLLNSAGQPDGPRSL